MYGYVVVNKPELKFREFDVYHSYYCGLCTVLKDKYGITGQMTLSYDMTFLILLLTGLYEPTNKEMNKKCTAHPVGKHHMVTNSITEYVADMNVLLTYNKCMDDWQDEKKLTRRVYAAGLDRKVKKITDKYKDKCEIINSRLKQISEAEKKGEQNIDVISAHFGYIMAEIFQFQNDEWSDKLRKMGFALGKFIYIIDAYEDLEADIKKDNYNPLVKYKDNEGFDEWCRQLLMMVIADCAKEFELLPILQDVGILRNIIYSGVWTRFEIVKNRRIKSD